MWCIINSNNFLAITFMRYILNIILYPFLAMLKTKNIRMMFGNVISKNVYFNKNVSITNSKLNGEIKIGDGVVIYKTSITGKVVVGSHSYLSGPNILLLSVINPIIIGKFCSIARGVQIQEYNHKFDGLSSAFLDKKFSRKKSILSGIASRGPVVLGNDV